MKIKQENYYDKNKLKQRLLKIKKKIVINYFKFFFKKYPLKKYQPTKECVYIYALN
jgi:hypothetical protein